jgi:hypothetical protein
VVSSDQNANAALDVDSPKRSRFSTMPIWQIGSIFTPLRAMLDDLVASAAEGGAEGQDQSVARSQKYSSRQKKPPQKGRELITAGSSTDLRG